MEISLALLIFVLTFSYGEKQSMFGRDYYRIDSGDTNDDDKENYRAKPDNLQIQNANPDFFEYGQDATSNENGKHLLIGKDYFKIDSDDDQTEKERLKGPGSIESIDLKEAEPYEIKQVKAEIAAGEPSDILGTNAHIKQPSTYTDLGRRFILQYPYKEQVLSKHVPENNEIMDNSLLPVYAPPELVLAVAKQSVLLNAAKPVNPTDKVIKNNILRTGNYWNSYWKEEGDPASILRNQKNEMKTIEAKLSPGTDIYDVVSKLQLKHPKLLYIINKRDTN